jgi:hypothetical protein
MGLTDQALRAEAFDGGFEDSAPAAARGASVAPDQIKSALLLGLLFALVVAFALIQA